MAQYNAIFAELKAGTVVAPVMGTDLVTFITELGYTADEGLAAKVTEY